MAKDLPYFKFFCSEWTDGDITLESFEVQGLFINICSYYWSNECDVNIDKLKKKFKNSIKNIDILLELDIIKIESDAGELAICFLDEQRQDRATTSVKNSTAGKKSAEARRLKKEVLNQNLTPVEIALNGNPTIKKRREEKREDKKKEEECVVVISSLVKREMFNIWINYRKDIKKAVKNTATLNALSTKFNDKPIEEIRFVVANSIENQYTGLIWDKWDNSKEKKAVTVENKWTNPKKPAL